MKLTITKDGDGDGFLVWAMLDDPDFNGDPSTRGESFVIGVGRTEAEAVDAALDDLKGASAQAEAFRR